MKDKKLAAIPLIIAITLSIFGLVYAHWGDYVKIEGTVYMGDLTLAFDFVEPPLQEEFHWDPTHTFKIPGEYKGKDVGHCAAQYEDLIQDVHTLKQGYKTLNITITNAYPQYIVHTTFKLHNIGTIPLNVCKYAIAGNKTDSQGNVIYKLLWYDPNGDYIGELWEDVNNNGVVDTTGPDLLVINIEITNSLPYQIDPCKTNKAEIDIDFKQDAEECHTYVIDITVIAIQWNKPCPP